MFSKPARSSSTRPEAPEPAPPRKPLAASLIAENVTLNGDVASEGDIQLDGTVHGDLQVTRLTVGESGQVHGAISAELLEVRGRVNGAITAREVRLHATAHVVGDITHSKLAIDAGAKFEGRSLRAESEVVALLTEQPQNLVAH